MMKISNLFTLLFVTFSLSVSAQIKISDTKYNKLIRTEKYTEALTYIRDKGGVNAASYWFSKDAAQLTSFCFDPAFDDTKYELILGYVNKCFKDMDYKDRVYSEVGDCYFIKVNHYLWKGDYTQAAAAYEEALKRLEDFKKESDMNPNDIKTVKLVIEQLYAAQLENHKLIKALRTLDVSALNMAETQEYEAKQAIKGLLADYDGPHKVKQITYENYSSLNDGTGKIYTYAGRYMENTFFYSMTKKVRDQHFPGINLNNLFGEKYKTKEQETQATEERKAALIKKYGKPFGESIFNGKIAVGMTVKMLEEEFNPPRAKEVLEYSEYWTWSNVMVAIDKKTQKVTRVTDL